MLNALARSVAQKSDAVDASDSSSSRLHFVTRSPERSVLVTSSDARNAPFVASCSVRSKARVAPFVAAVLMLTGRQSALRAAEGQ